MKTSTRTRIRKGLTSAMAMMFLAMAATLALGMYAASTSSVATASNLIEGERARSAAESGMRWVCWRFQRMTRPKTAIGNITPTVAQTLWPEIRTSIQNDLAAMLTLAERTITFDGTTLASSAIAVDGTGVNNPYGARFSFSVRQHPIAVGDPLDARYLRVTSVGSYRGVSRTISMDFMIDKKVKFAIVGKVPIQLGRNTLVEGPIGMATANKYPPIYMLSDFRHLNSTLANQIDNFNNFLRENHKGFDNRINIHDPDELAKATQASFSDVNGDSYIDEYDLFLNYYDTNHDDAITRTEFTDPITGQLYDTDLFKAIDALGAPLAASDPNRDGFKDDVIDNRDGYAKVRGQITLATTASAWESNLGAGGDIQDMIQGPIEPTEPDDMPIKFGANGADLFDLAPTNFDTTSFKNRSGTAAGATATGFGAKAKIENKLLAATDNQVMQVSSPGTTGFHAGDYVLRSQFDSTNAALPLSQRATGTNVTPAIANEKTPLGSTTWQATYARPVFKNMHFKNVRIPKGMNALFDNCTFEGVTYIDVATNITNSSGATTTSASDGMTWSKKMKSGSFSNTTPLTATNSYGFSDGNNLRFNNCTIKGPLASDVPTAYTHFTNSWEFTGATTFDNTWIDPSSGQTTATIVAPQANIEMGSFTDPASAPSTLRGVVVAGNLDIRGSSVVDGSIIITGDGAGNTTQGWFGPSDAATEPTGEMPEGGWGRLSIQYNPKRALPDGINIAIDIMPEIDSYVEGK